MTRRDRQFLTAATLVGAAVAALVGYVSGGPAGGFMFGVVWGATWGCITNPSDGASRALVGLASAMAGIAGGLLALFAGGAQ